MSSFERHILRIIRHHSLILPGEHVIAGVSGGSDSMALLHVLAVLRGQIPFSLTAVYCDHGLRPEETTAERELVREWAGRLGNIGFRWLMLPVRNHARDHGLSLEEAGRILRYRYFAAVVKEEAGDKIAIAHHGDDQAEEILIRLLRGTGRKGLSGMTWLREGGVIRPFLELEKQEIIAYLREKQVPYREDSSNNSRVYLRNRIRLDLIPYLREHFNPSAAKALRRAATILGEEEAYLAERAREAYDELLVQPEKIQGQSHRHMTLRREGLAVLPIAIARRVLEMVFWSMEARPTYRIIDAILFHASQGTVDSWLHQANGLRIHRGKELLTLAYPCGPCRCRGNLTEEAKPFAPISVMSYGEYVIEPAGIRITFEALSSTEAQKQFVKGGVMFLDATVASFPLVICPFRGEGERFTPLGAPGSKKVGDYLTDRKIGREKRLTVPLLLKEQKILAILGWSIDESARISPQTVTVVKISIQNR